MSTTISIDDLRGILIACAGDDDDALRGAILDVPFHQLGYDSLALMETAAKLERDYGVIILDDQLMEVQTPAELLLMINDRIVG